MLLYIAHHLPILMHAVPVAVHHLSQLPGLANMAGGPGYHH